MPITVDYTEMEGSPKENISSLRQGGVSVVRIFKCDWEDRALLAKQLLGYYEAGVFYPPDYYTTADEGIAGAYAREIAIEGLGINESGGYEKARLTVQYSSTDYDRTPDDDNLGSVLKTESLEPSAEFLTLSSTGLFWQNNETEPLAETEAPAMTIRMLDWIFTVFGKESLPSSKILSSIGKVNSVSVRSRSLNMTFGTETLLLASVGLERTITISGTTGWNITYRFTHRPKGWNKFPRANTTASNDIVFAPVYNSSGTQIKPYEPVSFGSLF